MQTALGHRLDQQVVTAGGPWGVTGRESLSLSGGGLRSKAWGVTGRESLSLSGGGLRRNSKT